MVLIWGSASFSPRRLALAPGTLAGVAHLPEFVLDRLDHEEIAWCTTLRPDGSPHTTPVWFCFIEGAWWIASAARSVKVRNATVDPHMSLALADGRAPVVAEGRASIHREPFPVAVVAAFAGKYAGWDVTDHRPDGPRVLLEVSVVRWLLAGTAQ